MIFVVRTGLLIKDAKGGYHRVILMLISFWGQKEDATRSELFDCPMKLLSSGIIKLSLAFWILQAQEWSLKARTLYQLPITPVKLHDELPQTL